MDFHEARSKANDGDKLKLSVLKNCIGFETEITVGEIGNFVLTWKQYDSGDWQIIPSEPEIQTAEEYIKEHYSEMFHVDMKKCYEAGHKSGRLELYSELRQLIDAFEKKYPLGAGE